ncbi:DUF885 domain-containing protein [Saccharothrix coeruleofusca]|uniref:DUF885 domain-containing protein n=1 Tax=Saccharothrix coeruleofusca TaxID=33919 RepID=A0A918EEY6_9PSEU|nr:DUF885 domain-containing protein [Saccharothrix coeruleofusca]GGP60215.1 hypothetical protein GCM10010185_35800 [Saccharothrix coeruleofusca]
MDADEVVREYQLLGLRLDRLSPGLVDAFTGDRSLRARVDDEPRWHPAALADRAGLLRRELAGAGLPGVRERFLDAHLTALECTARKLAGVRVPFVAEVRAYFQVDIRPGEPDDYRRAHAALEDLLPGDGPLRRRLADHREHDQVPPRRLAECVHALSDALRERVRGRCGLPAEEEVRYRVVADQPWSGFNRYLGGFRSLVAVNADAGHRMSTLPHLVAHESYPGHHTEHCRKEAGLVAARGHAEQSIFLINTPQCLLAEGLAELGLHAAVGPGWGRWTEEVLGARGLRLDGELAERVDDAVAGLLTVRQDAALMLHDRRAHPDDVVAFLRRWLLVPEERARRMVRFLADPLWRAYTTTYVEGARLVRAWLDREPGSGTGGGTGSGTGGGTLSDRYLRLLDEPLVPRTLQEDLARELPGGPTTAGDHPDGIRPHPR